MLDVIIEAARAAMRHAGGLEVTHTDAAGAITNVGADGQPLVVRFDRGREESGFGASVTVSGFWVVFVLIVDIPNLSRGDVFEIDGQSYTVNSAPTTGPQSVYWQAEVNP